MKNLYLSLLFTILGVCCSGQNNLTKSIGLIQDDDDHYTILFDEDQANAFRKEEGSSELEPSLKKLKSGSYGLTVSKGQLLRFYDKYKKNEQIIAPEDSICNIVNSINNDNDNLFIISDSDNKSYDTYGIVTNLLDDDESSNPSSSCCCIFGGLGKKSNVNLHYDYDDYEMNGDM